MAFAEDTAIHLANANFEARDACGYLRLRLGLQRKISPKSPSTSTIRSKSTVSKTKSAPNRVLPGKLKEAA
jgi:hypothetical protein